MILLCSSADHPQILAGLGVKGLRVIDASVFPVIPDCRIQNAVYMVAEKVTKRVSSLSVLR